MRIIFLMLFTLTSLLAVAQESYLFGGLGVGLSTLKNAYVGEGESSSEIGFGGQVGYSYFFDENYGVSTGIGIAMYNSTSKLDEYETFHDGQKNDLGDYKKLVFLHAWEELGKVTFVEIPILFSYRYMLDGDIIVYANAGVRVQLPISSTYEVVSGEYETRGYFASWGGTLYQTNRDFFDEHGFARVSDYKPEGESELGLSVAASVGVGVLYELSDIMSFYAGLGFDYGLTNMKGGDSKDIPLITDFDKDKGDNFDKDSRRYTGILSSDVSNSLNTRFVKLEIGLIYSLE